MKTVRVVATLDNGDRYYSKVLTESEAKDFSEEEIEQTKEGLYEFVGGDITKLKLSDVFTEDGTSVKFIAFPASRLVSFALVEVDALPDEV